MHNVSDPINVVDPYVVESKEVVGKECSGCRRVLSYSFFDRDTTYHDGRKPLCVDCEAVPRLSTSEHTARLDEMNFNSEAVKRQRFDNQLDYMNDEARYGKQMHSSEFISRLYRIISPEKLYLTDGNFIGDIAVYQISGVKRPDFDGPRNDFKYQFYMPLGLMPECSIYEFDHRAIPVREHKRGWRTVLLKLIKSKLISESDVDWEFGKPNGLGTVVYQRELQKFRNKELRLT